jgi:hypothetical protein
MTSHKLGTERQAIKTGSLHQQAQHEVHIPCSLNFTSSTLSTTMPGSMNDDRPRPKGRDESEQCSSALL